MSQTPVATDVAKSSDIALHDSTKRTFNLIGALDDARNPRDLILGQIFCLNLRFDLGFFENSFRHLRTDTVNVTKRILDPLIVWNVNTNDTWHGHTPSGQ